MTVLAIIDLFIMALPTFYRNAYGASLLEAATLPIEKLNQQLLAYYRSIQYRLSFNGTIISLEYFLNDQFDFIQRRIVIEEQEGLAPIYLFNNEELNESTYLFNKEEAQPAVYLYNNGETSDYQFAVVMPQDVVFVEAKMRAMLKRYVLPTMKYDIKTT
jgi:hypothetical protein